MDLRQQALIVAGIREKMQQSIGTKVYIKVNLGRSRINENEATITAAHPSVFIATLEYKRGRRAEQSFQYADILTGVVEVLLDDKPMFGPFDIQPDAPLVENKPKQKKRLRPVKPFEQRIRLNSEQVAILAERLKKEKDSSNNSSKDFLISELSVKYDLMKKVEKTKMAGRKKVDEKPEKGAKDKGKSKESAKEKAAKKKDLTKTAKKSATKKKTKAGMPAKKTAVKKTATKKAAPKKSATKKVAKKSTKKTVKKPVAKVTSKKQAKKPAVKKTAVKKPATKKSPSKKTTAKKPAKKKTAKKTVAKKSTSKTTAATKSKKSTKK